MSSHDSQEPSLLHEKLKDQVALSIKESLEKATAVLSNLHRVQSYLDIIKTMTVSRPSSPLEGIHGALDQVKSIRSDTATLLQTIYLAEIGLQSLQDFDKHGSTLTSTIATLEDSVTGSSMNSGMSLSEHHVVNQDGGVVGGGVVVVDVDMPGDIEFGAPPPPPPPLITGAVGGVKKDMDAGFTITSCVNCGRRFATQRSEEHQLCKTCKSQAGHAGSSLTVGGNSGIIIAGGISTSVSSCGDGLPTFSSTPTIQKVSHKIGKRGNAPPMSCKICNISFHYKRCLFRHLKENHSGIDVFNLHKYIIVNSPSNPPTKKLKPGDDDPSLCVNLDSDLNSSAADSSGDGVRRVCVVGLSSDPTMGQTEQQPTIGSGADTLLDGSLSLEPGVSAASMARSLHEEKAKSGSQFVCSSCSKAFDRPYRLQRHLQIHNPNRPRVACHVCDRTFTRSDTLENHIKCLHTEERPFQCQVENCNKTFATQSTLFHHQKTHTNGKPYSCHECNASFAHLNEYKQHMRDSHADTENLRCNDCYKVFVSSIELNQHKLVEHRLECELCGKTFARLAYLKLHIQIHEGDNLFNCQFCTTGFDTEYAYKQHLRIHPEYQTAKRTYHCQVCAKVFQHSSNLLAHYRSQKHKEMSSSLDINTSSILTTIEGDLTHEMGPLVDEVTLSSDEDNLIQSITESEAFQAAVKSNVEYVCAPSES